MEDVLLSKFVGTVLGAAVGDALGKGVEDLTEDEVIEFYGGKEGKGSQKTRLFCYT